MPADMTYVDASTDAGKRLVDSAWRWHHFNPDWVPSRVATAIRLLMLSRLHTRILCSLDTGQRFWAYPDDIIQCTICMNHEWEGLIYQSVRSLIRNGATVLDVGAHVGYSSVLLGDWVGPTGKVHAFEPLPWHREQIDQNLRLNGFSDRVTVQPFAVTDKQGTASLYYNRSLNTGMGSLHSQRRTSRVLEVDTIGLDQWREVNDVQDVDLVKIDVEGAELGVLDGMRAGLRAGAYASLLVELHPEPLSAMGRSVLDPVETLQSFGYTIYSWTAANTFVLYPEAPVSNYILALSDVGRQRLAVRPQSPDANSGGGAPSL